MSIAGIGFDLVEVKRFKDVKKSLIERIFNKSEIEYVMDNLKPEIHFAGCFAAKEAFLKAIGTGLSNNISWKDIELRHKKTGEPFILFRGVESPVLVTVSHTDTTAGAVVILFDSISI